MQLLNLNYMKKPILLSVCMLICTSFWSIQLQAQLQEVYNSVSKQFTSQTDIPIVSPFSKTTTAIQANIPTDVEGEIFSYSPSQILSELSPDLDLIQLQLEHAGEEWNIKLEEVALFTEDFLINTPQGPAEYNKGQFFRGVISGKNNSLVSVSVFENEIIANIAIGTQHFTLGKLKDQNTNQNAYILYDEAQANVPVGAECQTPDPEEPVIVPRRNSLEPVNDKCVSIYFEIDYDVYQEFGSSVQQASDFIAAIFNESTTLYANEGIKVQVSEFFVWTTPSPYSGASSTTNLNQFESTRSSFNGNLAHLVDMNPGNGGIAYVDVLCKESSPRYAYSGLYNYYEEVPTYSWNVMVITHEIGHNLGSAHTHSCSWPGGPIDNCYAQEGLCLPGPSPDNGGTIMSYCHLTSDGINFNNGFGPLPGDLIRNRVSSANCLFDCEGGDTGGGDPVCETPSNIGASNITQTSAVISWDAVSTANDYTFEFREASASNWTSQTVASNSNTLSGLSPLTTYEVRIESNCSEESSGFSPIFSFSTLTDQPTYCTSQGNNSSDEWIGRVEIGTFVNNSGASSYTDFTTLKVDVTQGDSYAIQLSPEFSGSTYSEGWKIWIDFNRDGDFTDAGEEVYTSGGTGSSPVSGTISIPSNVTAQETRMRISMKYNGLPSSCESFSYGEVEDYTVNIQPDIVLPCETPVNVSASASSESAISVSWDAASTNESSFDVEYRVSGTSNWTVQSASASPASISGLNPATQYDVRVKANCNSAESNYSTVVSVTTDDAPACDAPTNLAVSSVGETSISVSWDASANANAYQLEYVVSGGSNWSAQTESGTSATISGLTASTSYDIRVSAECTYSNSPASNTVSVTTDDPAPEPVNYCTSQGNNSSDEWIASISIGAYSHSSGNNGGYADFTSEVIALNAGDQVSITLNPGFNSGFFGVTRYPEYWKIWIDYNRDGDFDDAGELAFDAGTTSNNTVSGSISVPSNIGTGNTRMRVSMKYNGAQSSCESFAYGEVEDYTVSLGSSGLQSLTSKQQNVSLTDGVQISPNPVVSTTQVSFSTALENAARIQLIDLNGKIILTEFVQAESQQYELQLESLMKGSYIVMITSDQKLIYTGKILKF